MSLKKPFGWTESARLDAMMRRMRVKEITRVWHTNRPAAIAITVIGVLAAAMLIGAYGYSARRDMRQAARTAVTAPETASASESPAKPSAAKSAPVTITGCLVRDDEAFRLKDTDGADAPKSRSWKTGFLKKGSASIQVLDTANRLKLDKYVGQRVSVTGTLVDREMHPRTLQRIAPSCAGSSKPAKTDAL